MGDLSLGASPLRELWGCEPFEMTIQAYLYESYDGTIYYPPPNNIIKMKGPRTGRFRIILKNVSSDTQSLLKATASSAEKGMGQIFFESTDESGNRNVVTKKIDASQSKMQGYSYIGPGKSVDFDVSLTPKDWEGLGLLVSKGARKLRTRAAYKNGTSTIYSDYYTVIIEE